MTTYLYIWHPDRWRWVDQSEAIYRVNTGEQYDMYWACGNTKKIIVGDTFLLMRLGVEPKGIIGCGYIVSNPYLLPHWDVGRAKKGDLALRTDLLFKALSEEPVISLSQLQARYSQHNWTPQAGGYTVPEPIGSELFAEIQRGLDTGFLPISAKDIKQYAEGKTRTVTYTTYDRSPIARQACIEHYGHNCTVCGFNFAIAYGPIGENYIEVHHLKQVADIGGEYLVDPVKDLRPVCANCHRMLHKQRPPLAVEDLIVARATSKQVIKADRNKG